MIISGQERAGRTPTSDTSGDLPRSWRRPRWAVTLDAAVIGALAAFAWWTLLYEVMLAEGWPTTPVMVGWLVTAPFVAVPIARWNIEHARRAEDENWRVPLRPISRPERKTMLLVAVAVVVCAVLMGTTTHALFRVGWGIGIIGLLAVGHALRRGAAPASPAGDVRADVAPNVPPSMRRTWDDVVAVVVSCGVAIASLFVVRTSSDDVYYVNLSTWIAEHGHIPLRDTMYGDQTYPSSYGGGFPLSSIEAQLGALARLFDVRAGTIAYLVVAPLCTFASMWVLWQLALLWSRRGPMPAFLFSVVFVLAGAGGGYRSYSTVRIWQGKVMAFAIVIPLIWIFATRLARTRDRHWAVLLSLAGVAFVGLTSTAALLGLTLACAIALAAVILMNRSLLWGVLALAVPALVSGTTVAVLSRSVGGATPTAPTAWAAVRAAYGAHPTMAIVTIAAVMVAPLLVRGTAAATLIWCSGVASLAVLTPGVLSFLNAVTGSGPVEWRLLLSPPAPTLIGLCAATGVAAATRGLTSRPVATRIVSAAATLVFDGAGRIETELEGEREGPGQRPRGGRRESEHHRPAAPAGGRDARLGDLHDEVVRRPATRVRPSRAGRTSCNHRRTPHAVATGLDNETESQCRRRRVGAAHPERHHRVPESERRRGASARTRRGLLVLPARRGDALLRPHAMTTADVDRPTSGLSTR